LAIDLFGRAFAGDRRTSLKEERMRDHGGNIDWAQARYGGDQTNWIDLSTGINRVPYPVPEIPAERWAALPTATALQHLRAAAAEAYGTDAGVLPCQGAQWAIQTIPRIAEVGTARILAPTYNEHAASFRSAGWDVEDVANIDDLKGADAAVIVNPNNPDGQRFEPQGLEKLAETVRLLVIDESFVDASPELSVATRIERLPNGVVLRSFGKFYGLAGVRLGFVLGHESTLEPLREAAGPWPVTGPAIEIGTRALYDKRWRSFTMARLASDTERMDALALKTGWTLVGGTMLFRLYDTGDAKTAQEKLAQNHIWSRAFPYSDRWLRLGLPGSEDEWDRLSDALSA